MTDDLITWLRAQIDEDEAIANRWLFDYGDKRHWKVVGGRRLFYDNGCAEDVTAIDVDNVSAVFNEKIYVKNDLDGESEHIARHDPARVLREVEAKRRMIAMHERDSFGAQEWCRKCAIGDSCDDCLDYSTQVWPCATLKLLALPFSDRPGYREEWRP